MKTNKDSICDNIISYVLKSENEPASADTHLSKVIYLVFSQLSDEELNKYIDDLHSNYEFKSSITVIYLCNPIDFDKRLLPFLLI